MALTILNFQLVVYLRSMFLRSTSFSTYSFSKGENGFMISATVGFKHENLMQGDVGHPEVVLAVHRDHVRHEKEIFAPRVDDMTGAVHS